MDAVTFVRTQIATERMLADAAMAGLTDDQANWVPPGTANTIAQTLVHLVAAEDMFVHRLVRGVALLWDSAGWAQRFGLAGSPGAPEGWDALAGRTIDLATALAYRDAVRAAVDATLAALTAEDLVRKVPQFGGEQTVADILALMIGHSASHGGEIIALKGVQGLKGLPF